MIQNARGVSDYQKFQRQQLPDFVLFEMEEMTGGWTEEFAVGADTSCVTSNPSVMLSTHITQHRGEQPQAVWAA